jgi:putative transcriptional regulator
MYHYTESGLQNVWLESGYVIRKTPYGKGVSINDVAGLHRAICKALARQPRLTGAELRFLRKELGLSQSALSSLLGTSEQNISLWERRGHIPKVSDRMIKLLCLEKINGNVKILEMIERLNDQDIKTQEKLKFQMQQKQWKEAA